MFHIVYMFLDLFGLFSIPYGEIYVYKPNCNFLEMAHTLFLLYLKISISDFNSNLNNKNHVFDVSSEKSIPSIFIFYIILYNLISYRLFSFYSLYCQGPHSPTSFVHFAGSREFTV